MKLKRYLKEQRGLTKEEFNSLDEVDRYGILGDFRRFNIKEQQFLHRKGWRPMTPEELKETEEQIAKEMERRRINAMIGGIDERGNYKALHYRWEEPKHG